MGTQVGRVLAGAALVAAVLIVSHGGSVRWAAASGGNSITTVDSGGDVGWYSSLAIGTDGKPVISYMGGYSLKVAHCGNATCSSGNTITTVDSAAFVGYGSSIAIGADGKPLVSYWEQGDANYHLKVAHCGNSNCSSGNSITTIDSVGLGPTVTQHTSLAIGTDGKAVISYSAGEPNLGDLKVAHCGNATCSSGNTISIVDSAGGAVSYASVAIGTDGKPVISYGGGTSAGLKVAHCGNATCSSGNTITTVDSAAFVGSYASVAIGTDGKPVISYTGDTSVGLKVAHCGNATCSSGNTITTVDSAAGAGIYASLAIGKDGKPVISYFDSTSVDLKVAHCGNATCSSGNTISTVDSAGYVGYDTSLAIGKDGKPVISYYDWTNSDLKVAHCGSATCTGKGPDHKVLFINGINSESYCQSGGFSGEVQWMVQLLGGQLAGYRWVDEYVGIESSKDFLYFDYTSDGDSSPRFCSNGYPDYRKRDTCWSLDDYYRRNFFNTRVRNDGEARRLANYIDSLLDNNPGLRLTLIGFSQGGLLAAGTINDYIGNDNRPRINAILTFDSPLQGIPLLISPFLCQAGGGGQFDSPWDMKAHSSFVDETTLVPYPRVPLYTVDSVSPELNVIVSDYQSRIPGWEGVGHHVRVGSPSHSGNWRGETRDFGGRTAAQELTRLRRFVICAAKRVRNCTQFVGGAAGGGSGRGGVGSPAAGAAVDSLDVQPDSSELNVLVTGDPSYYVALTTPSGTIIDASSSDPGVVVEVLEGAWTFQITDPEAGTWQVKSDTPDPTELVIYWDAVPAPAADKDGDAVRDTDDNCANLFNEDQVDTDLDGLGNVCDEDDDADGVEDGLDNCPDLANADQADSDSNGHGDACDVGGYQDWDSDGLVDNVDNCELDSNPGQDNFDGDVAGDVCDPDDDFDGCTDEQELGSVAALGGLRDPLNPWDFYDVNGDKIIDLFNDILGVIDHWSPGGGPPYDVNYDRGPVAGPNPWNMTAPDGVIDLFNDILGVINQWGHDCR